MISIDKFSSLCDRSHRKVYGVIVVDHLYRFKYGCTMCDGEFLSADGFVDHFIAQHIIDTVDGTLKEVEDIPLNEPELIKEEIMEFEEETAKEKIPIVPMKKAVVILKRIDDQPLVESTANQGENSAVSKKKTPKSTRLVKRRESERKKKIQNKNRKMYQCYFCKEALQSKQEKELHINRNHPNALYKCECGKNFKREATFLGHYEKMHNIK